MDTNRLEAFSDGVTAIAITLLVLEIKVPPGEALGLELLHLWPSYLVYAISFVVIGAIWINHHAMFGWIVRADHHLLLLNTLHLMFIAFLPFPTAVLAEAFHSRSGQDVATAFYAGTLTVIGVLVTAMWRHAASHRELLSDAVSPEEAKAIGRRFLVGPTGYGCATLLAFPGASSPARAKAGWPTVPTYNGPDVTVRRTQRRIAMRYVHGGGIHEVPRILRRDEYFPACTIEGDRVWVGHIPGREERAKGGLFAVSLRRHRIVAGRGNVSRFTVTVVNHPLGPVRREHTVRGQRAVHCGSLLVVFAPRAAPPLPEIAREAPRGPHRPAHPAPQHQPRSQHDLQIDVHGVQLGGELVPHAHRWPPQRQTFTARLSTNVDRSQIGGQSGDAFLAAAPFPQLTTRSTFGANPIGVALVAFTKPMQEALNTQICSEFSSAYTYLSMSAHCAAQNLNGFAAWLRIQAQEEAGHAMKIYDYLEDRGGRVILQAVDRPAAEWKTPLDLFENVLAHERKVTGEVDTLYALSVQEKDYASQAFLQWFVTEQIEEEKIAGQVVDHLRLIGDNRSGLLLLDRELGQRSTAAA